MSYSMMGATGESSFKLVGGIAKPVDSEALANFQAFQQQLGRFSALRADGDIGPATAGAYNRLTGGTFTVSQIAAGLPAMTAELVTLATSRGLALPAPLPASRPVVQSNGTVKQANPPPITPDTFMGSAMDFMTTPTGMIAAAGAIGLLLLATRKKRPAAAAPAVTVKI